jgi:predicted SnoaL-like aldol condensation-catalyzing enzyme
MQYCRRKTGQKLQGRLRMRLPSSLGVAAAGVMLVIFAPGAGAATAHTSCVRAQDNRAIVTAFADQFYRQKDVRGAFTRYAVPNLIEHNPGIADGRAAAIAAFGPMFAGRDAHFEVKRIVVDGDLAVIHAFGQIDRTSSGAALIDIYRLDRGKIVELWDVFEPIPKSSRNPHPMF